jgi:hypothetical protein
MNEAAPVPNANPKKRWGLALAAAGILVAGAGGAWLWWRSQTAPGLLEVFPDDSYLVATLDVASLRKGALADLASEGDAQATRRAEGLLGSCSEGAVRAIREVGLVVPGGTADEGTFALAARLDTSGTWLAACEAELASRSATTPRESEGAWVYVGAKEGPRLALHRSGLALWGREPYVHTLAAAAFEKRAEGRYPALAARTAEPTKARDLVAAITLPAEQRRIFASVIEEQGRSDGHPELFAIARAALVASIDAPSDALQVTLRLECDKADAPAKLRGTIDELLQKTGDSLEARALGIGDALAGARVVVAGDAVVVTASAPIGRLRMMSKRLRLLGEMRRLARDQPAPEPLPAAATEPTPRAAKP